MKIDASKVHAGEVGSVQPSEVHAGVVEPGALQAGITKVGIVELGTDKPRAAARRYVLHRGVYSRNLATEVDKGMSQKVRSGGTPGKAPLGYSNIRRFTQQGREERTVEIDGPRAELISWAFTAFATGEWTLRSLANELEARGLTTRRTPKHPARPLRPNVLHSLLTNPYYKGDVVYRGVTHPGNHQPLLDPVTWQKVQAYSPSTLSAKNGATILTADDHPAHGELPGRAYTYFFCRNKQKGICQARHVNVLLVEEVVEAHYATVRFGPAFVAGVRAHLAKTIDEENTAVRLLHQQPNAELRRLDGREENLIDLAADGSLPQDKIKAKLHDIEQQRQRLTARLTETNEVLANSAQLIETCLKLLENPQELYRRCDQEQRRLLNQAIFRRLYIEDEQVAGHDLHEPFARLHAVQRIWSTTQSDKPSPPPGAASVRSQNTNKSLFQAGKGLVVTNSVEALLAGIDLGQCSS